MFSLFWLPKNILPLLPTLFLIIDRFSIPLLRRLAIELRAESYFWTRLAVAERNPSDKVILVMSFFRKGFFLSEEVGVKTFYSVGFSILLPELRPEFIA